jgi:hypothetical protein
VESNFIHSEFFRVNAPIALLKEHLTLLNDLRSEHKSVLYAMSE